MQFQRMTAILTFRIVAMKTAHPNIIAFSQWINVVLLICERLHIKTY